MAPKPKNKDKQQQKEKKKQYDRLRREIMKSDPEKALKLKLKEQEKYRRKKEKNQVKLVAEMSEREKRAVRKKWRERSLAYLKRKREKEQQGMPRTALNTSLSCCGSTSTPSSSQKKAGRKRVRRAQTQTARENQRLRTEILKLRRKNEAIRKLFKRTQTALEKSADPTSPRKVVRNLMESKDNCIIRKKLLQGEVLARQLNDSFRRLKSKRAKRFIADALSQENGLLKKYGLLTKYNFLKLQQQEPELHSILFSGMDASPENIPMLSPLENVTSHVLNVAPNMTMNVPNHDINCDVMMMLSKDDDNDCNDKIDFSGQEGLILNSGLCYKCGGSITSKRTGISCDICEKIIYHLQCANNNVDDNAGIFCCAKCDLTGLLLSEL